MEKKHFAVGEAIRWGFKVLQARPSFFVGIIAIFLGVELIKTFLGANLGAAAMHVQQGGDVGGLLLLAAVGALAGFFNVPLLFGLIKIMLNTYDYGTAEMKTLFSQGRVTLRAVPGRLALVSLGFLITAGCIVPCLYLLLRLSLLLPNHLNSWAQSLDVYSLCMTGFIVGSFISLVYISCRYCFFEWLIVDKNMGVLEAYRESSRLTHNVRWKVLYLFGLLGVMLLSINLFFSLLGYLLGMTGFSYADYLRALPTAFAQYIIIAALVYAYRRQQENVGQGEPEQK